jgi:hypothetical protein
MIFDLSAWVNRLNVWLAQPSPLRAIFFALVGSALVTQVLKFYLPQRFTNLAHKRATRLLAAAISAITCFVLWPVASTCQADDLAARSVISLLVGGASPTLYAVTAGWAYSRWPLAEKILSARPGSGG